MESSPTHGPPQQPPQEEPPYDYDEKRFGNFRWLTRESRGSTYNTLSQFDHYPACSFDWGESGFAGSSNYGGELLYLSAPSARHGLITTRGNFSTSLYASLSRAQIEFGGPATFGLEISRADHEYVPGDTNKFQTNASSFRLGTMVERGCFNYRWPFNEYYLDPYQEQRIDIHDQASEKKHLGTCQMFSCVMDGTFYQVLRVEEGGHIKENACKSPADEPLIAEDKFEFDEGAVVEGDSNGEAATSAPELCRHFPAKCQLVLTMGGPVWFRNFGNEDRLHEHNLNKSDQARDNGVQDISMEPQGPRSLNESDSDADTCEENDNDNGDNGVPDVTDQRRCNTIRLWDRKRQIGLEAQVHQLVQRAGGGWEYKRLPLSRSYSVQDTGTQKARKKVGVTAFNATVSLPNSESVHEGHRSAVFLAAIRLFEVPGRLPDKVKNNPGWRPKRDDWKPRLPSSEQLYKHICVSPWSKHATGAMWETIFIERVKKSARMLHLAEVSLIGRSLEKILEVDIIPAHFDGDQKDLDDQERKKAALVSNLFVHQNVDLKSLFWKIRFLVRTHKFLIRVKESYLGLIPLDGKNTNDTPNNPPCDKMLPHLDTPLTGVKQMLYVLDWQLSRIKNRIESVIRYLVFALLYPKSKPHPHTRVMPDSHLAGETNYYYVITTIWYVVRNFPGWDWDWKDSIRSWTKDQSRLSDQDCLPPDNWTFMPSDREKLPLLQWFHHGAILGLCKKQMLSKTWMDGSNEEEYHKKVDQLAKVAHIAAAAKLSSRQGYIADDEIIDRLSFVSDELGLEHRGSGNTGTVASLTMRRVKARDNTRALNPGWVPHPEDGSTSGPWEIHALCHHSRLLVASLEEKDSDDRRTRDHMEEEIEVYKEKIAHFLNAEGTLTPSWERAHTKARKGWLLSESAAVVGSTLLIINEKDLKSRISTPTTATDNTGNEGANTPLAASSEVQKTNSGKSAKSQTGQRAPLIKEMFYLESLIKQQVDVLEKFTGESGRLPPIIWEVFRPSRRYHPLSFFNSLEDTPEQYQSDNLKKRYIPVPLLSYATPPDEIMGFTHKNLKPYLKNLFVSDITATGMDQDRDGFTWEVYHMKHKCGASKNQSDTERKENRKQYWALYDNLVDQEVQHRFLTVRNLGDHRQPEQDLLDLLIYVIHPESAACLADHMLGFARFSCQPRDTWVSSITLRTWLAGDTARNNGRRATQSKNASHSGIIYLEKSLERIWSRGSEKRETWTFELDISSIVISTNSFGDFSKVTVVSELISEDDMKAIVEEARKLWQKFIHQPQAARCLVLFLVLGKMCQQITANYKVIMDRLNKILDLNESFKHSEQDWKYDEDSRLEFELGLWSLETLYKLHDSLKSSVDSVFYAKAELMAQIKAGPGNRGPRLEGICQEYLGAFEGELLQLTAANLTLEGRINQVTRHKESFSAVLGMRDSRASLTQNDLSLKQNGIVQRLTYLTILYLPFGLMAAMYAIPNKDTVVVNLNMGLKWFIGAIIIVSAFTFVTSVYIGHIVDGLGIIWVGFVNFFLIPPPRADAERKKRESKSRKRDPPNIWRYLWRYLSRLFSRKPTAPTDVASV